MGLGVAACEHGPRSAASDPVGEWHPSIPASAGGTGYPRLPSSPSDTARPPLADPDSLQPGRPWRTAARYLEALRFADEFPSSETREVLVSAECGPLRVSIAPERRSRNLNQNDFRGTVRVLARATVEGPLSRCVASPLAELGLVGRERTSYLVADGAGGAYWMFREGSTIRFSRRWRLAAANGHVAIPMARWWTQELANPRHGSTPLPPQFASVWIVCAEGHCTARAPEDTAVRREP